MWIINKKIFVHIPKCAGMTIRRSPSLEKYIHHVDSVDDLKNKEYYDGLVQHMIKVEKTGPNPTRAQIGVGHCRWRDIHPSLRNTMDSFAVIRNPWDRVVSRYFFARKTTFVEGKDPVGKFKLDSFEDFLEERHEWGNVEYMWHRAIRGWFPAKEHVSDSEGNVRCDIIRFENLNSDLEKYFSIPKMDRARNVTGLNEGTYMDMYNDKTIQIVADWYKDDIETWGYDFDTGPTKNYWAEKL
jgi:hypothetical protein